MKRMFISNLASDANENTVRELFAEFGTVREIRIPTDVFTGKSRGFGYVDMERHEARAAIAGLNGRTINDRPLRVKFDDPKAKGKQRRR